MVNCLLVGDFLLTRPNAEMILSHETTIVLDSFIVHDEQSCHWQLLVPSTELGRTHKKRTWFSSHISSHLRRPQGELCSVHLQHVEKA